MSRLDATPKPPTSTAAHRRALRATTPFETPFLAHFFFCPFRSAKKWENAFKVGSRASLPAGGRRLSRDGVRGLSPPNKPTRGRVFLLAGAAKFIRLPPACSVSLGGNARGWVRATQISNFCEIEFTRLTPRMNAREAQAFIRLTPSRPASWLNGLLSAVSVAKIKRVGMSSPHRNQPVEETIGKGGG
ncbi:hypothetical protein [Pectobacterium versatile]|uniref:hypothetical protein n=1 Tax=Pectobacterium versatile TaxID=2488639 RepID=UPI001B39EEAF|nr:hypothetical protein [Pectobacterium versatile]